MTNRTHPPIWLFSFLPIAGGVYPFAVVAMPFLLRREGIPVEKIGSISGLVMLPLPFVFLAAPLADMILSRRNWIWASNLVGAILLFVAILLPRPKDTGWFVALLFAGNTIISGVGFSAVFGLMAVLLPDAVRGRASGWYQVGNIGSIPLIGGAALWLIQRASLLQAAAGIAAISFLPSLLVLFIDEPPRSLALKPELFRAMFAELARLLKRRQTWLGLLIFLSPLGAGAAYDLFSAVGTDYHASSETVLWVTGLPWGVIVSIGGALLGGAITDLFPRRMALILFGGLLALAAAAMAIGPLRPVTFAAGGLAYQFMTAMSWVAGTALSLELCGTDPVTAATRMALFQGATNAAFSYMPWFDGRGYHAWGVRGLFATDAVLALASAAVLLVVLGRFWRPNPQKVGAVQAAAG